MLKFLKLIIPFILISTGAISCTLHGFAKKDSDIINEQMSGILNRDDVQSGYLGKDTPKQSGTANASTVNESLTDNGSELVVYNLTDHKHSKKARRSVKAEKAANPVKPSIPVSFANYVNPAESYPDSEKTRLPIFDQTTSYGAKGLIKKPVPEPMELDLDRDGGNVAHKGLPADIGSQDKINMVRAGKNLENTREEDKEVKAAQLEDEGDLATRPDLLEHEKKLCKMYCSLGNSYMKDQKYENAVDAFNKALKIDPALPQIKEALEKAHANLGGSVQGGELDKDIVVQRESGENSAGYGELAEGNHNITGKDGKGIADRQDHSIDSRYVKSVSVGDRGDVLNRGAQGERVVAEKVNTKKQSQDNRSENQHTFTVTQGNNTGKSVKFNQEPAAINQIPEAGNLRPEQVQFKTDPQLRRQEQKGEVAKSILSERNQTRSDKRILKQVGLAHLELGIAYAERGMIDEALSEFQSAVEINPHHLESHVQLGKAYRLKGMKKEALSELRKAINIDLNEAVAKFAFNALPQDTNTKEIINIVNAHISMGNAYKKEGEMEKAQLEYEKALALEPGHSVAKKLLGHIHYCNGALYIRNKEYENAINAFNKVLALNPDFPKIRDILKNAHYNLGVSYAKNGELNKAILEFNETMKEDSGYAMLDKGNFTSAGKTDINIPKGAHIATKEIVEKPNSNYSYSSYQITAKYKSKAEIDEEIKRYEDATRKNPYDNNAFLNLARAYYSKAMYLDEAIAKKEDTPQSDQKFMVKRFYLNNRMNTGRLSDAHSTESVKLPGEYTITFPHRFGEMYHNKEMFSDAINEYKKALDIDPTSLRALYNIAFSITKKNSSLGVALNSKNNSQETFSGF